MADLRKLNRGLAAVGLLPPSRDDHEGWRDCLTKLCSNYLGSESKEDSDKQPLPADLQGAALQARVEERRKRILELDLDLGFVSQREAKLRKFSKDPLLQTRSADDFARCLQRARARLDSVSEEEIDDGLDLAGFVEKLTVLLKEVT
ncbi:unnamed protein product [Durusdinium trenchii]|uniref:Uncharacterized protein n=2 Tax=Durusdinium trenchii TaxID=1381693 RepID=A0ABP0IBS0_9DINO